MEFNLEINIPTLLVWNEVTSAEQYILQVSTDTLFNTLIINDSTLSVTSKQVGNLTIYTKYYWRVKAKHKKSTSIWSATSNFTTR